MEGALGPTASVGDDLQAQVGETKLIAALVLFLITLICGYLPVRIIFNQNYVQHAMFAGGGVLMATAFCHLIPEAHDSYKAWQGNSTHDHMHTHQHQHQHNHHNESFEQRQPPPQPVATNQTLNATATATTTTTTTPTPTPTASNAVHVPYVEMSICCGFFFMYLVEQLMMRFMRRARFLKGLLIVSAFGTHSVFDGVAIGSQDSVEKVWMIFVAISCHKLIIVAVVGLQLFAATLESHLWTLVHLILFSVMSPIGIILVVVAQDALQISSGHPAMILLQSFATGTLLYIIFVEILQPKEDQYHAKNRLAKSFSLIAGFGLMLTVLTLIDH